MRRLGHDAHRRSLHEAAGISKNDPASGAGGEVARQPRDRKEKRSSRAERSRESVGQPVPRPSGTLKRPGG